MSESWQKVDGIAVFISVIRSNEHNRHAVLLRHAKFWLDTSGMVLMQGVKRAPVKMRMLADGPIILRHVKAS